MWKNGTELVHLEWADFSEEILATVYPKTFIDKSARITSPDMSADAIKATLETGLENVQAIIKMFVVRLLKVFVIGVVGETAPSTCYVAYRTDWLQNWAD